MYVLPMFFISAYKDFRLPLKAAVADFAPAVEEHSVGLHDLQFKTRIKRPAFLIHDFPFALSGLFSA